MATKALRLYRNRKTTVDDLIIITEKRSLEVDTIFPDPTEWFIHIGIVTHYFGPGFCCTIWGDDLIYLGGFSRRKLKCINNVICCNLIGKERRIIRPTLTYRQRACVVELYGKLYYLGGKGEGGILYDLVECWDPKLGRWDFVAPMIVPKSCMSVVVLNGRIYAAGGHNEDVYYNTMAYYDPKTNTWTQCQPMAESRSSFGFAVQDHFIYAVGGYNKQLGNLEMVERYNSLTDTWMPICSLSFCRRSLAAIVLTGRLLAVGGTTDTLSSVVEEYDPVLNVWNVQIDKVVGGKSIALLWKRQQKKQAHNKKVYNQHADYNTCINM